MLKNLVNIAILTTIVVIVWLAVSIYQSLTKSTIAPNVAKQIIPISPNFNTTSLSSLEKRTFIPVNLSTTIQKPTPTPSENVTIQGEVENTPVTQQPQPTETQSQETLILQN